MRFFTVLLCLLAWLVPAQAVERLAHEDPFANFRFPQHLGGYNFQNHVTYPRVGLGYGLNYVDRAGGTATIAIYDLNLTGIANGTTDARVIAEFNALSEAIATVAQQGGYRTINQLSTLPSLSKAWLQVNHELIRPDGRRAYAFSFIRAENGKFVKIRISASSLASYERLPIFLLDVSRAIGLLQAAPTR